MSAPALVVQELALRYPGASRSALDGVGFEAPEGAFTALLGPSGCGKSSVLRVVAGLLQPQGGVVRLQGFDLHGVPPEARAIGLVSQSGSLFQHRTVLENARFALDAAGVTVKSASERAMAALETVGLAGLARRRPASLSGGEQQRLALARALARQPRLLLLDEPLSSVQPQLRRVLRDEIRALQKRLGLTVLYVTHDQHEALAVADHLVLMDQGRVVQAGTPHALYEAPANAFAAAFMGDASLLPGHRSADGTVWLGPLVLAPRRPGVPGPVTVAVRPQAWRLLPCHTTGLPGSVARRRYLGRTNEYLVRTPLGDVLVHARDTTLPLEPGAPVSLQLTSHGAAVLAA